MVTFFDEERESIVGYYILPLLGINRKTFGSYFKDAKILSSKDAVIVELYKGCKEPFWENKFYQTDYTVDSSTFAIFSLPEEFNDDIGLFCEGKYSQMSQLAKNKIYKHSGLYYNKQIDNLIVTDMKLLALSKSPILRNYIQDIFKVRIGKNLELLQLKDKNSIYTKL